jgi:predicted metal-dependent hydrolase
MHRHNYAYDAWADDVLIPHPPHHTRTNILVMETMNEAINELKALSDRYYGPTIQHALHRLTVAQGCPMATKD